MTEVVEATAFTLGLIVLSRSFCCSATSPATNRGGDCRFRKPIRLSLPGPGADPAPARHRPVARQVSPAPPPPSVLRRAGRALGALTFGRLARDVRAVDVPSAASSPNEGLLVLGGTILLLIALSEVGFLTASVRLLRRP